MSERPATCLATRCVVCHDLAHRLGEICPSEDRCPVRAVSLGMACRRCHDRMASQLREIPELYALAAGEMQPGQGSGGRSSEVSIGIRISALDLRTGGDALERLATWERDWRETFDIDPVMGGAYRTAIVGKTLDGEPVRQGSTYARSQALDRHARGAAKDAPGASLVGVVGFLLHELHRAASAHYAIDDFARELGAIHTAAKVAARTTGRRNTEVDCPADQPERGTCGARIRISGLELDDVVYCSRCRSRWTLKRLLRVAAADSAAGIWIAAEDAALLVGISRATLDRWAKAGRVRRRNGLLELQSIHEAIRTGGSTAGASA